MERMVTEKISAFSEGLLDASWQAGMFYASAAFGQSSFTSAARAALSITKAGIEPARRAVQSNALRLKP